MSFIYEAIDQAKKKKNRYKWILVMWKKDIDYLSC
jgi:hypothetical protein